MDNWIRKDLKYLWHPYTQMKDCRNFPPPLIEKGKGIKLYDSKGNFYYDTISSWWCNVHGHNHPKIKSAIKKQLDLLEHVLFAGFTHKPAILLAERLVALTRGKFSKVFFSDNGSTAVEVALKMSFQYWRNSGKNKKRKFISLDYGYHGDTVGTMSVSGVDLFNEVFSPLFSPSIKMPSPYCYRCPLGLKRSGCNIDCLNRAEKLLKEKADEICAIILEPMVMCASGMIVYPKEYLERIAALAKKYNTHLILDEVATGFGRTGKMFAYEHVNNIRPDFLCLSKGISGGYLPLAATLTTDKIYGEFYADYEKKKTFYHGHTYTANPVSCSAGLASLRVFEEENTLSNVKKLQPIFQAGLERIRSLPFVGDVRHIGLIAGIELVKDKKSKEGFSFKKRMALKVYKKGLKSNLILRPLGDVIYLFLPLSTKKNELEDIFNRVYPILKSLKP
ncbi:MAG: adenosylmethionine--8-amino-7-oxononanoate transaminase [Candidatus Omnitrophota bacterium]|jgi:adenosylmethionine-8-amino-7-oxononanoate aminotransferase